jgi:nucleoside-diphosphate-sugar epimerase
MLACKGCRIPEGEWILVTGADGYIASHVVDVLLQANYNVRGSVREPQTWLEKHFEEKYGPGRFHTALITDLTDEEGFDRSTSGMSGVIHTVNIYS